MEVRPAGGGAGAVTVGHPPRAAVPDAQLLRLRRDVHDVNLQAFLEFNEENGRRA